MKDDHSPCSIEIRGERLTLLPEKAIFWKKENILIVSDVHLGKAGHFRKHGIPVPTTIHFRDLQTLSALIERYSASEIIFLGDLFHSDFNAEWRTFAKWMASYNSIDFILVRGNHDILVPEVYKSSNLALVDSYELHPFLLSHMEEPNNLLYNISGHIHPCVSLKGKAKQGVRLPCFYFGRSGGFMPAFGNFTGNHPVKPKPGDRIFGIIENTVVRLMQQNPVY